MIFTELFIGGEKYGTLKFLQIWINYSLKRNPARTKSFVFPSKLWKDRQRKIQERSDVFTFTKTLTAELRETVYIPKWFKCKLFTWSNERNEFWLGFKTVCTSSHVIDLEEKKIIVSWVGWVSLYLYSSKSLKKVERFITREMIKKTMMDIMLISSHIYEVNRNRNGQSLVIPATRLVVLTCNPFKSFKGTE